MFSSLLVALFVVPLVAPAPFPPCDLTTTNATTTPSVASPLPTTTTPYTLPTDDCADATPYAPPTSTSATSPPPTDDCADATPYTPPTSTPASSTPASSTPASSTPASSTSASSTPASPTSASPTSAAPTTSTSATSSAPVPTSSSLAAVSDVSSNLYTGGYATYFYQNGNAGACGQVHSDYDYICAMDQTRFGTSGPSSPLCGKQVQITNTDTGKTITVTIADDCPTCDNENSIDLSVGAFSALASLSEGIFPISWSYV